MPKFTELPGASGDPQLFFWSLWPRHYQNASDGPAESYQTYATLDSVLFELSNISHRMNIGQGTAQHLSHDLMFAVCDEMTQIKYFFCGKVQMSSVL